MYFLETTSIAAAETWTSGRNIFIDLHFHFLTNKSGVMATNLNYVANNDDLNQEVGCDWFTRNGGRSGSTGSTCGPQMPVEQHIGWSYT